MLPFKLIYSDDYYLPIGSHVFPAEKYQRIHQRLLETGMLPVHWRFSAEKSIYQTT